MGEGNSREYPPQFVENLPDRPASGEVYSLHQLYNFMWSRVKLSEEEGRALHTLLVNGNKGVKERLALALKLETGGNATDAGAILEGIKSSYLATHTEGAHEADEHGTDKREFDQDIPKE